jgi:hypothetical protein
MAALLPHTKTFINQSIIIIIIIIDNISLHCSISYVPFCVGNGERDENDVGEAGGDIQQELLLHVPHHQDPFQRARGEHGRVRAGRDSEREGHRAGSCKAWTEPKCAGGFHRR